MRKEFITFGILLIISLASFAYAAGLPSWKDRYANDFAGIFNDSQLGELRALFAGVDSDTSAELVFVSAAECAPFAPSQYANELFVKWGIGKKDKDNGLLILYCKSENKIWVEAGYGLEGILPDSKVGRMLDDFYVPLRDGGDVPGGIIGFSEQAAQVIEENKEEVLSGQASPQGSEFSYVFFFIWLAIFILIVISRAKRRKHSGRGSSLWWILLFLPRGGGGGGFGGGGFGGGSSGGGGAGR